MNNPKFRLYTILVLFTIGTVCSLISIKHLSYSYIWIFAYWFICFVLLNKIHRSTLHKSIWFNLAFVMFASLIFEGFCALNTPMDTRNYAGNYVSNGYFNDNKTLGYAGPKNITTSSSLYYGKRLIYSVKYSANSLGWRKIPKTHLIKKDQSIIFFGGSFTFGEGVNDNETLPYYVQKLSGYKAYNFGFHGYGPHQMLSQIEFGLVESAVTQEPKFAIYQFLLGHASRASGKSSWDKNGPKYILQKDNTIKYAGHFNIKPKPQDRLKYALLKSAAFKTIYSKITSHVSEDQINLLISLIKRSKESLTKQFPDIKYHVIYWDVSNNKQEEHLIRLLRNEGINMHLISSIIPDYSENEADYVISEYDKHPNPKAYKIIAEYVVKNILN